MSMDEEQGLYGKYKVRKAYTTAAGTREGPLLFDVFVLRPDKDSAALAALGRYAETTNNEDLAKDLYDWIEEIEAKK